MGRAEELAGLEILNSGLQLLALGEKTLESFGAGIRSSVRGLWTGVFSKAEFLESMRSAVRRGYTEAWGNGAKACGIDPTEFTQEERSELQAAIRDDLEFAEGFADSIISRPKGEGTLESHFVRAAMWTNGFNKVFARAQQLACANQKLKWLYNPLKEHCEDCRKLNGRVHRASTWQAWEIQPQMHDLECRGFRCGCRFVVTTEAASRGRPVLSRGF